MSEEPGQVPPQLTTTADYRAHAEPGAVIAGRYTLVEKIGEGGMGVVWIAKQTEPVKRKVALKLIKAGMDSKAVLARFEQERQALAMMDHPNIARVLDGGLTGEPSRVSDRVMEDETRPLTTDATRPLTRLGSPFFVMELVNGLSLTKFCDQAKLTPKDRLELFVPICQAVQHAHQKGIVHRDLKPSNILVTLIDGKPVPKVIDFGVAKATGGKLIDESLSTQFGAVVGTLEYMSPEQAGLSGTDIDTRADIYSLGVILYELLTGLRPIDAKRLRQAAHMEMLRIIQEEEPPKPSTRLSSDESLPSLAALRQTEPKKLMALLRGELDWVVMKCLEKNRERRYVTANALGRDIQRYLADEPVEARPPSLGYRASKFLRRNKGPVLAASLLLVALVAGIVGTSIGMFRAERALESEAEQRGIAETKEKEAQAEKKRAIEFRDKALDALRATTGEDVELLIAEKKEVGANERAYLEAIVKRWQKFAAQEGDDEQARALRGEGHFRVGFLWAKIGRNKEAMTEYLAARDILTKLVEQFPVVAKHQQDLVATHNNLANLFANLGRVVEARLEVQVAHDIQKKLVGQFPTVPEYQQGLARTYNNLGLLFAGLGKRDEARAEFQAARAIQKKLVEQFPTERAYRQELACTHNNLGSLFTELGKVEEARQGYQAAFVIRKKLAEQFPAVPIYQQELANTHKHLGELLQGFEKCEDARVEYQTARDILKKLVTQFPAMPAYQQELADAHKHMGKLLQGLEKGEEARAEYQTARDILKKLVTQFPAVPAYQQELAGTHNKLGSLLLAGFGKREEARKEFQAALDIWKQMVEQFPGVPAYQIDLGVGYGISGILLRDEGKPTESLVWFDLAIRTLKPAYDREPCATAKLRLRTLHWNRAIAHDLLRNPIQAVKDWNRAIELSPSAQQLGLRASRVNSQIQADLVAEAVAEVAELTAPVPDAPNSPKWNGNQWYDFACVYAVASGKIADKKKEYADRAMELLQKAVQAGFNNAAHLAKDSDLDPLRGREDFKKMIVLLQKNSWP